ncbi:catalase [Acephala macrosclerotiorum]|nr:catalase [Acephala macrosclerotiorum]
MTSQVSTKQNPRAPYSHFSSYIAPRHQPTHSLKVCDEHQCPQQDPASSFSINKPGGGGLLLLQDTQLIETLAHFARERIPERVVYAKAAGAFGEFDVTHGITDITSAAFLSEIGKKTPFLVRISTVGPERGSADTVRDVRGWAMKLFTEEGNQDWVFNDIPVFFVRDPIKFPSVNRSHKRHPQTNLTDATMVRLSDVFFHNNNQEGIHALMCLFSDRGTPTSLRNIDAFSGHTYKFTKKIAGENPDYNVQDLFENIAKGNFPSWTAYVQTMTAEEAEKYRWNIFDMTKVWPHTDHPLRPFGKLIFNRNASCYPQNYFSDIEQAAFLPSTMVPGIEPSADPMLQARMFSYPDAARYRLGVNYQMLPTNCPISPVYSPMQRDGFANFQGNYGPDPNYVRSSFRSMTYAAGNASHDEWVGKAAAYTSEVVDDDFVQATALWKVLGTQPGQQEGFISNVAGLLKNFILN